MQSKNRSGRHAAARAWAEAGIPVFPCIPGGKLPATPNGFYDATLDLGQIDAWAALEDYNWAIVPESAGLAVVDQEAKDDGPLTWENLQALHGRAPDTYTVQTPSGGLHYHYAGSISSTVRKLGRGIDTRGVGGYVLIPPSVVGGNEYRLVHDVDPAPLPEWIGHAVREAWDRAVATYEGSDTPHARERGVAYLAGLPLIREKQGADAAAYAACAMLRDFGLSDTVAFDLMLGHFQCSPQDERYPDFIQRKIKHAYRYAVNEPGSKAVAPAAEVFSADLMAKLSEAPEAPRSRFYFEDVREQEEGEQEEPEMVPGLIPDASTVLLVGAKGTFKTFIAHHLLLGWAAGVETLGLKAVRQGPTFYAAHEGRKKLRKGRRRAWELVHDMKDKSYPFFIAGAPYVADPEGCEEFREQIRVRLRKSREKCAGVVLDTVAKCLRGLDEDTRGMGVFVDFCDSLVYEFECPVLAIAHTGKGPDKRARGAYALEAGFTTVIDIEREASKVLKLSVRHQKDGEEVEKPWLFKGHEVAGSLVFQPLAAEEYEKKKQNNDPFERAKVGGALKEIGAIGKDKAITTAVLANQMTTQFENEDQEIYQKRLGETEKGLRKLSKFRLSAYCHGEGRTLTWSLPL